MPVTASDARRIMLELASERGGVGPEAADEAWRRIVGLILDDLDLGERTAVARPLVAEVHRQWGRVIHFTSVPPGAAFTFSGQEGLRELEAYFTDAVTLLGSVRNAAASFPGQGAVRIARIHHELDFIKEYLDMAIARFGLLRELTGRALERSADAVITLDVAANEFILLAQALQNILAIVLGDELSQEFGRRHDECVAALNEVLTGVRMPPGPGRRGTRRR